VSISLIVGRERGEEKEKGGFTRRIISLKKRREEEKGGKGTKYLRRARGEARSIPRCFLGSFRESTMPKGGGFRRTGFAEAERDKGGALFDGLEGGREEV